MPRSGFYGTLQKQLTFAVEVCKISSILSLHRRIADKPRDNLVSFVRGPICRSRQKFHKLQFSPALVNG